MFDFKVYNDENKTLAILAEGSEYGYSVIFNANERFTSVVGKAMADFEHIRVSVVRHLHNEKKIGAYSHDIIGFSD